MIVARKRLALALAAIFAVCPATAGLGADIAAGKKKAAVQCAVCHGRDGIAVNPDAPNLAGENPGYIERQLQAFRSGERQNEQMSVVAKEQSDEDIRNLAAWYAAIKVTAEMPDVK